MWMETVVAWFQVQEGLRTTVIFSQDCRSPVRDSNLIVKYEADVTAAFNNARYKQVY
jgi:hypothetical protein